MRFGVLGPLAVWTDGGESVAVPGLKVRALLADLLLDEGRPVSADRLIDDLWGDAPPGNPPAALSAKVSQLRRVLEDAEPGARRLVTHRPAGYALEAEPGRVDAHRFQESAAAAREAADPERRAALLADALGLWRGAALADFADEAFTQAAIARLEEARLAALEDHAEVRLELGEHGVLAGELADLLAAHPLRERLRAAHMRALYRSGRQSEALDSFEDLRVHLADELGLDPGAELVELHGSILNQAPELAAPERDVPRTNLPAPAAGLVGRDEAVDGIRERLGSDRLVTLTGPGGVGKTRLAIAAATGLTRPDGVWMVELAGLEPGCGAGDLVDAVMRALDIREMPAPGTPGQRLAGMLAGRRLLLFLDNCEHVIEAAAELIRHLLGEVPGLAVLATSREPLDLAGEIVWNVPPLDVPDRSAGDAADLAELERSAAVRLFTERAAASARGFALDGDTAPAVATLCRRLDGIPLALELAATRVRSLGVHGLVARLDDRFRLLATGHRGAPPRQRTLTAMIDWSWELLDEPERAVLRRLAVQAESCSVEAAEAVCAGPDLSWAEVLDILARLVDRSLVVLDERAAGPRYRLLESVAAYCTDRLRDAGEYDEARARHRRFYTELAERAEPHLYGGGQDRWLRVLDTEAANMRAALDGPEALRLANALTWYWLLRGRPTEALRALTAALDGDSSDDGGARARATAWRTGIAAFHGESAGWPSRRAAAVAALDGAAPADRARGLWFLAYAGTEFEELAVAEGLLDQAMEVFQRVGDSWGEAAVWTQRAVHAHARSETAVLERCASRAARIFGRLGDRWGQLQANQWLAGHAELTGDHAGADRIQRETLRMAEELHLWPEAAVSQAWLGWIALYRGRFGEARAHAERALATGQPHAAVFGELVLGFTAHREGDADEAESRLRPLLRFVPDDEDAHPPLFLSMIYMGLGGVAELRGDASGAFARYRDALAAGIAVKGPRDAVGALEAMAAVLAPSRPVEAARFLGAATAIRQANGLGVAPIEAEDIARTEEALQSALAPGDYKTELDHGATLDAEACLEQARDLDVS